MKVACETAPLDRAGYRTIVHATGPAPRQDRETWEGAEVYPMIARRHAHHSLWVVLLAVTVLLTPDVRAQTATAPATAPTTQPNENTLEGLLTLSQKAYDRKSFAEARTYCERALQMAPDNPMIMANMAYILSAMRDNAAAMRYLLDAGRRLLAAKDYTTAEKMFEDAAAIRQDEPGVLLGLAMVYGATGQDTKSLDYYRRYTQTDEGRQDPRGYLAMGRQYEKAQYPRQAISVLRRADALKPNDPEILTALAMLLAKIKDPESLTYAERAFQQAGPDNLEAARTYATILMSMQTERAQQHAYRRTAEQVLQAALDAARQRLERAPDDRALLQNMIEAYQVYGTLLNDRLKENPRDTRAGLRLSQVIQEAAALSHTNELHRALAVLTEAARNAPTDIEVLRELASVQVEVKKLADAAETCRRILAAQPDNAFARDLLARIGPATTRPAR